MNQIERYHWRSGGFALRFIALLTLWAATAAGAEIPAPITDADYGPVSMDEARLGRMLFFDPILSGNRNISCATCHHPRFATSDGLSLGLGEGGISIGPERRPDPANPPEQRIPRNAQALFNLGAREFTVMFHDGRIEIGRASCRELRTPLEDDMVAGFASILSAQTMFPVLSPDEMAGHYQENDVSTAVREGIITRPGGAWVGTPDRLHRHLKCDRRFRCLRMAVRQLALRLDVARRDGPRTRGTGGYGPVLWQVRLFRLSCGQVPD